MNTVKRCLNIAVEGLKVKKSESDFSFFLLQACLKTFTGYTLKEYIIHCHNVIGGQKSNCKTMHHLCASHMPRDYMRKIARLNIAKRVRFLAIQAFSALQNTVTINETQLVFEEKKYATSLSMRVKVKGAGRQKPRCCKRRAKQNVQMKMKT